MQCQFWRAVFQMLLSVGAVTTDSDCCSADCHQLLPAYVWLLSCCCKVYKFADDSQTLAKANDTWFACLQAVKEAKATARDLEAARADNVALVERLRYVQGYQTQGRMRTGAMLQQLPLHAWHPAV